MPTARSFDADLAAIDAATTLPREEAIPLIRKSLAHPHNLIVARAAKQAVRLELRQLTEDVAAAFRRHLSASNLAKADPQCWAKTELAKTLAAFESQDHGLFLTGLHLKQLDPSFGGFTETAGTVRETCALALVQCHELSSYAILRHLTPVFSDKELPVRTNVARAIAKVGSDAAALLLRLRAELGSDEPEVLGACLNGVLSIEGPSALPWVANFLAHSDLLASEAAFTLAEHRSPQSAALLQTAYNTASNPTMRLTLLATLAATRLPAATTFLLYLISSGAREASAAADALYSASPSSEVIAHLQSLGYTPQP